MIRSALKMPTDSQEVTAIEFDGEGGYLMAVGSSAGKVWLKHHLGLFHVHVILYTISAVDF